MNKYLTLIALHLVIATFVRGQGQRPAQLQINSMIMRIPIPENSQACYTPSNKTVDASGITTLVDNGPVFNQLQDQLTKLMTPNIPTADQIAQMQQETMAQANANRKPPAMNPAVMKELGQASGANMQATQLINELTTKLAGIKMTAITPEPNCPEVQQGGYAGPTCACTLAHAITDEKKRVAAKDQVIQAESSYFREYRARIMDQVAIVDKLESDAKYGEGMTDATLLSMLWSAQRQAMAALTSLLSISSGIWRDGATQYLYLVNGSINHCK